MVWISIGSGAVSGLTAMIIGTGILIILIAGYSESRAGGEEEKVRKIQVEGKVIT